MAEEMHPEKGSGRDNETQRNLLRKVINQLQANGDNDVKNSNHISDSLGEKLDTLNSLFVDRDKKDDSKKGDELEEKKESKALFSRIANGISGVKEATVSASSKAAAGAGGLLAGMGNVLGKGLLGGGALLAGAGLLAGGAGMFINSLQEMDADAIKEKVKTLLSIKDDVGGAGDFFLQGGAFLGAMTGIGLGLAVFSAGSTVAGMSQGLLDYFGQGNWAQSVKDNVLTLISINEAAGGNLSFLTDSAFFLAAMTGIAGGLAIFGVGSSIGGLSDALTNFASADWAQSIKDNVITLLSINEAAGGNIAFLADSGSFLAAMSGIGLGLAVFGAGSGIAGMADALGTFANPDWAQSIKDNVLTLLSISEASGGNIEFLKSGGTFFLAMSGIGAGLAAFGIGSILNSFLSDDFGQKIKTNVVDLLSISDAVEGDMVAKSANFSTAMGSLSAGLAKFSAGNLISSLANAGSGILNFFTGGQSPIEQMFAIAEREDDIKKAARGIDRLQNALQKLSGISIGGGNIDIQGMLDSFGHLPRLLRGLAYGGEVEFETTGFNKKVDFAKGILDPTLKIPEISATMNQVNSALGLGPVRNSELNTQTSSNAELKMDAMTSSGDSTFIAPTTNTTNNTSSQAVYGDASPATDDLDRVA